MKKILLIVLMMAGVAINLSAQTEKGKVFIMGSSDLSLTSTTMTLEYDGEEIGDADLSSFNFTPTIGYFVADGLAMGLSFNIENSKQDDITSNSLLVGPMARYYIGSSNVKPFVQAGYYFGSQTEENDVDESKAKATAWDIGGGAAAFINEFASIDFSLGYGGGTVTSKEDEKMKLKVKGLAVNVGFSLYF
ncbi:outer membrane beta-barrel protein [Carboxylicivirga sediminis]|uniref:Outer membrane beta-barrel protein n=1 Tax=Carboxylicivirga sediminis TaxID=2006564 RepID=A0A941IX76_9BACT|nr:outer membrane beta-barrel protein [Carboxylicivirga sediminis]MBR8534372.1 outer membrane beta-barrel protein [Carboxylicivirga sediminis]